MSLYILCYFRIEVIDTDRDIIIGRWTTRHFEKMMRADHPRWCGVIPLKPEGRIRTKFELGLEGPMLSDMNQLEVHIIGATSMQQRHDLENLEVSVAVGEHVSRTGKARQSGHGSGATAEWFHRMNFKYDKQHLIHFEVHDDMRMIGACVFDLWEASRKKSRNYSIRSRKIQIVDEVGDVVGELIVGLKYWDIAELRLLLEGALSGLGPIEPRATRARELAAEAFRLAPENVKTRAHQVNCETELAVAMELATNIRMSAEGAITHDKTRAQSRNEIAKLKAQIPQVYDHMRRADKHAIESATYASHDLVVKGIVDKEAIDKCIAMCLHALAPADATKSEELVQLEFKVREIEIAADIKMKELNESFVGCKGCSSVPPCEEFLKGGGLARAELALLRQQAEALQLEIEELTRKEREMIRGSDDDNLAYQHSMEGGIPQSAPNGSMFCCCCC